MGTLPKSRDIARSSGIYAGLRGFFLRSIRGWKSWSNCHWARCGESLVQPDEGHCVEGDPRSKMRTATQLQISPSPSPEVFRRNSQATNTQKAFPFERMPNFARCHGTLGCEAKGYRL